MKKLALALSLAVATAGAAEAKDGFYYGGGLSFGRATSNDQLFDINSKDSFASVGVTLGYRFSSGQTFFGGELMGDVPLGINLTDEFSGTSCTSTFGANGPYYCDVNSVIRLRGIVGTDLGDGVEGFITAGVVSVSGSSATSSFTQESNRNTGFTVGFGAQTAYGNGMLRGELIIDRANHNTKSLTPSGYEPDFRQVSVRLTYLFN